MPRRAAAEVVSDDRPFGSDGGRALLRRWEVSERGPPLHRLDLTDAECERIAPSSPDRDRDRRPGHPRNDRGPPVDLAGRPVIV
jgi:hypothetical protein